MTSTQIILVILSIIGSIGTGIWIGMWWQQSCSQPLIDQLVKQLTDWEEHSKRTQEEIQELMQWVNDSSKIHQQIISSALPEVIGEHIIEPEDIINCRYKYTGEKDEQTGLPIIVPIDEHPTDNHDGAYYIDRRINTGNNHC